MLFISRARLARLFERLSRNYDRKFSFVEDVINSCKTMPQLENAATWAFKIMESGQKIEKRKLNDNYFGAIGYFDMLDEIDEYFSLKEEIIKLLYDRKIEELEQEAESDQK